jgi:tellurite resistance protein
MSTIDNALKGTEPNNTLNLNEAFAAIGLMTIGIDGNVDEEELLALTTQLSRMKLFRGHSREAVQEVFRKVQGVLRREGFAGLITEAVKAISPELRETAFAVAADLTLVDGAVEEKEKQLLNQLHIALGIDEKRAAAIIEVMVVKNKA